MTAAAALAGLVGCTHEDALPPLPPEDSVTATGPCNTVLFAPPAEAGLHVAECSAIKYPTNPPCMGHHYPIWANYQEYDKSIPPGYWVHSIEHGGVALLWGCDRGDPACAQLIGQLESFVAAQPQDPECTPPIGTRALILPYPRLGSAFAAVLWSHYLRADCFDQGLVSALIARYYGKNYEDTCAAGFDPSNEPASCGMP